MEAENLYGILDMAIGVKLLTRNILQIRRISNFTSRFPLQPTYAFLGGGGFDMYNHLVQNSNDLYNKLDRDKIVRKYDRNISSCIFLWSKSFVYFFSSLCWVRSIKLYLQELTGLTNEY